MNQQLIDTAYKLLEQHAVDAGHNKEHHQRVENLTLEIVQKEQLVINQDVLRYAAAWHDIPNTIETFRETAQGNIPEEEIQKVVQVIKTHEYDKRPSLLEAKILWDADKLDSLSMERGRSVAEAIKRKEISASRKNLYVSVGKLWLRTMRGRLHFAYSRKIFDERLQALIQSEEVDRLAQELHVDLTSIRTIASKQKNPFLKLLSGLLNISISIKGVIR